MTTIIVLFNLKSGVSADAYELWARETDMPGARALASVSLFEVLKSIAVLGSAAAPPYQYIERIVVNDLGQLGADIGSSAMQKIAAEFQAFADNPVFIVTENL